MTLIIGIVSKNSVTVMSDIGITYSDKSLYTYKSSIIDGNNLEGTSTFVEEKCHKVIALGENAILAFAGEAEPALDRIRQIKAMYNDSSPEDSIRWVLERDTSTEYSFIIGIRCAKTEFKLMGFNVNSHTGISYSQEYMIEGSGLNNPAFVADAVDLIDVHSSLQPSVAIPVLLAALADLCSEHDLNSDGVSGPIIACRQEGPNSPEWESSYSLIYYDSITGNCSRCFSLFVYDGTARYVSTATSVGNRTNWIMGADCLAGRELKIEDVINHLADWDKKHRNKYDEQFDSFAGAPILLIDERASGSKKITFIGTKALSRSELRVKSVELVDGAKVTHGFEIDLSSSLVKELRANPEDINGRTKITIKA